MNDADAQHFDEQRFNNERRQEAVRILKRNRFPLLRPTLSAMIPAFNRASVFDISAKAGPIGGMYPVARYDSEDVKAGHIKYTGPRLTQFHKRVLLGFMQLAAGGTGDVVIEFNAKQFLTSIGRDAGWRSVEKLRVAIADLRSATFTVCNYETDRGTVFGWVIGADWSGNCVEVRLDKKVAWAFDDLGHNYLPVNKRNRLVDGLQTWLLDLIFSSKQQSFGYDNLAAMLGRHDVAGFGKEVRNALAKVAAVGAIEPPEYRRGRFTVSRVYGD